MISFLYIIFGIFIAFLEGILQIVISIIVRIGLLSYIAAHDYSQ
jgi:hypothetical protein